MGEGYLGNDYPDICERRIVSHWTIFFMVTFTQIVMINLSDFYQSVATRKGKTENKGENSHL